MKNSYPPGVPNGTQVLWKWILAILLLLAGNVQAQQDIPIGTGTTTNGNTGFPHPMPDYWEGSRQQYLFLASELTAAGMGPGNINAIKFNVLALATGSSSTHFTVDQLTYKIGTTNAATLDMTTWMPGTTTVWPATDYLPVLGINTFTFQNAFFWNGLDNIIIEICTGKPGNDTATFWTGNAQIAWTTGLSFNATNTRTGDDDGSLCNEPNTNNNGSATTRPNIIFNWTAAAACTGAPNAGTANTNKTIVCLNELFNLNLTGVTIASGLTYQWQVSTDNINWNNIAGATNSAITTSQGVSSYYRAVVTCTAAGASGTSSTVQVTSPALVQGNFTIDKNAIPAPAGTFNSFNDAYSFIKCGISGPVTFNVAPGSGPYTEQLIMTPVPGASGVNTVTFNGNGNAITSGATSGERAVIKLNGADNIIFDSLVITTTGASYGFGVQLINDADSNSIRRCQINVTTGSTSDGYAGVVMSSSHTSATGTGTTSCDFNTLYGNTITGGYYGFTMVASNDAANRTNSFVGNTVRDYYLYGAYIYGSFNALIDSNLFTRPTRTSVSSFYGVYVTNLSARMNLTRNRITNPFGGATNSTNTFYGIYFSSVDALTGLDNVVSNNLIYNITGSGDVYGLYNSSSDNVLYYHNTVALDGTGSSASGTTRGFYQTTQADGLIFQNNIIYISRGGNGSKYGIYLNTPGSTIDANRNDYFIASTTGNRHIGFRSGDRTTLADWQNASGKDANSIATNPVFTNPGAGDYRPVSASVDNSGAPVGILTDITALPRSATTPDIGAYEFTPPPCTAPPVAGNTQASHSPVCALSKVTLTITDNSLGLLQTYQWQVSDQQNGTYTNIGNVLTIPDTSVIVTSSSWYRCAVTCSGFTEYSTPVFVEVTPRLPGDIYTIDPAGSGAKNYVSFAAAKEAMKCGIAGPVVFNVVAGSPVFNEQLILDSIPGASAINTITFNGNGNTIKFSSNASGERAVIKLRGADFVTFDNLVIDATGSGSYGYGVQLIGNADSNTISRCTININPTSSSSSYSGIVVNAAEDGTTSAGATLCDGNLVDSNTINHGYYGITLVGGSNQPLLDNRITRNTIRNFYTYGVYLSYGTNTLVEKNNISRATRTDLSTYYGIYATGVHNNLQVSKNRLHNPFGGNLTSTNTFYGIYLSGADAADVTPNIISNNIIYNVYGNGDIYAMYNSSSDNARYYHNTISLDDQQSTQSASFWARGIYQTGDATGIEIKNNIITITRTGNGPRHALYMSSTGTQYVSDYNDLYVAPINSTAYVGYSGGNISTLANWQTATSQDAHSISMDPVYADPTVTGNFTPVVSPLDNTGTPAGIGSDIVDVVRNTTTPDMGAYEFSIPPCVTPIVAGTSVANPNSGICMGTIIQLTVTGNSAGGGQTYQWESAVDPAGTWTNISEPRFVKEYRYELGVATYFRCKMVCGTDTAYSTPVQVIRNPALLAGIYTIDPAAPVSPTNFQSFATAVAALDCGITGHVVFNVVPGTYNEQIRMRKVPGAGANARVTFQSGNGLAASVILTYDAGSTANYVLKLDSASYITYKNLSIVSIDEDYGRVVELAGTSSYDSIMNCNLTGIADNSTSEDIAVVYADRIKGINNVIWGNTIKNGSNGVHLEGEFSARIAAQTVDSNTISGMYQHGVYVYYTEDVKVNRNTVTLTAPMTSDASGIYSYENDSLYEFNRNNIVIANVGGTKRGMYIQYSDAPDPARGYINNNIITAVAGNTGTIYGLYENYNTRHHLRNNVIAVKATGSTYGLYINGSSGVTGYNNSVNNSSTTTSGNYAAYLALFSSAAGPTNLRNNIFSHTGGGIAYYVNNPSYLYSDYNMFYTSGTTLIRRDATNIATIQQWRNDYDEDVNSIVFKPAFVSESDLHPDVNSAEVWGIHGRGVQIEDNDRDFNDSIRPTTLTAGVPDLGAFEFVPASIPFVLPATPATAAPGDVQTFMLGTDTVMKITWAPTAAVPSNVEVRRYSGVKPVGFTGTDHMYFYTDVDVTPAGPYNYSIQQFYIDPWQGFISSQPIIKLGRTNSAGEWLVDSSSVVDELVNTIFQTGLDSLDKFTGLTDGRSVRPPIPPYTQVDSSNRGTQFWVAYGHHYDFSSNGQDMVLYLSAQDSANVTVRINGTSWVRRYAIPANSVKVSDIIPKGGLSDARLTDEGLFARGISITSDVPIVAYAHIYAVTNSGATMLLPVGTYGYEYASLNSRQFYSTGAAGAYSWFYVIADHDSTLVEITPAVATKGGKPANTPFTVYLNRGEVYNVMGTQNSSGAGTDMTGSLVRALPNANGKCYPIALFSGSSRTAICYNTNGDNMIQQVFPSQAWGKKYLAFATASTTSATEYNSNIFRVMVKDTSTDVQVNGVLLPHTDLILPGKYYQFNTTSGNGPNGAIAVEANKPVLVAQYMVSSGANECAGITTSGVGDPELIYISPVEQGIKSAMFYNTNKNTITNNYINVIIANGGVPTLLIDNNASFADQFPHPFMPGYTCIRYDLGGAAGQHTITSDSAFTAITYGLGSAESYGYNAGTLVKNLQAISSIINVYDSVNASSDYTCSKTRFRFSIMLPVKPTSLTWKLSEVANLSPAQDVVQSSPTVVDSMEVNGLMYYKYTINTEYSFSQPGTYHVPIYFSHPSFESCNNSRENILVVKVIASPVADFTVNFSGCAGQPAQFNGDGTTSNGVVVNRWNWNFTAQDSVSVQNPAYTFAAGGAYPVKLTVIGEDGCVGDTIKLVEVHEAPAVEVVSDSLSVCAGETARFEVKDPVAGVTYQWYDAETGGLVIASGAQFDIPNIAATVSYYVEAVENGCASVLRKKVTAYVAPVLATPIVNVDSLGVNLVRFRWDAVPNASGYEVSANGATWVSPSSGATGLTHTVAGLQPLQSVTLTVKALGGCEAVVSEPVTGKALPDGIYIPNSFTPNGDGVNDVLQVYGYVIKDLQFMVFNQWGEKIFESRRQSMAWDGKYKGKVQPSGVYMYVTRIILNDGTVINKKGTINLIR